MNILLISPAASNLYAKLETQLPPLGLAYIAAVSREAGHKVRIIDLNTNKKALREINLDKFDVIGISADTPRYPAALNIAKEVKKHNKTVVMGGYHVTFMDNEALLTGLVDFIVRGEGEEIFLNLLNTLENNGNLENVLGISYRNDGKIIRNRDALPPQNLDDLPLPARDLLPITDYKCSLNNIPFANLVTSRGCPFNCYFCSSSKFGGLKWRARSAKSIVDEIEFLHNQYGYKAFAFVDDNFTLNPKRVLRFADELEARKLDIIWWCFSRVDTIANNEFMVKRMADTGAYRIFLGLESVNENILDSYGKKIKNEEQIEAINILRKYGIGIHASFIIGDFDETEQMVLNTINWAKKMKPEIAQFSILTPFPGTALYEQVIKENRLLNKNWELFDAIHPTIKLNNLTPKQVQRLFIKSYQKFYFSFSRIFHKSGQTDTKTKSKKKFNIIDSVIFPLKFFLKFRFEIFKNSTPIHFHKA